MTAAASALTTVRSGRRSLRPLLYDYLLPVLLVAMVALFAVLEPQFVESSNLVNVARQSVFLLLITLGQMI